MSEKIVQLNEEAIKGAAQGVCLRQDGESSPWDVIRQVHGGYYPGSVGRQGHWDAQPRNPLSHPCGWHPVVQQEVHEHEAPGGCRWGGIYCRLNLFIPEWQTKVQKTVDTARQNLRGPDLSYPRRIANWTGARPSVVLYGYGGPGLLYLYMFISKLLLLLCRPYTLTLPRLHDCHLRLYLSIKKR